MNGDRRGAIAPSLLVVPLLSIVLAAAPAPAAEVASAARATSAVPMPGALADAAATSMISAPAYFTPTEIRVRTRAGNGAAETGFQVAQPDGAVPVWGDWWGRGVETPAFFDDGRWKFYDTVVGPDPVPVATARYGTRGDRPVVGDWDGDGNTDLGVVRGARWFLTSRVGLVRGGVVAPGSTDRFYFGSRGAQPLAGDWDGDGTIGIASFRGGEWRYRGSPDGGRVSSLVFDMGRGRDHRSGGRAVAGDWDGDGVDQIGLVRGTTWRLRAGLGRDAAVTTRDVGRPGRSVPAPWRTSAGPTGASCPTASDTFVPLGLEVRPAQSLGIDTETPVGDVAGPVRESLITAERFLLNAQYEGRWSRQRSRPYIDMLARERRQELAIRRPAMAALTVAVGLAADGYDHEAIGRTRDEALDYVDFLVRAIACQHVSVTPRGWGWGWQTAHWANLVAEAAWLVWDDLPQQTRDYVTSMVASEADFRSSQVVDYWRDAAGHETPGRKGNTASEELAWNSALLDLATTMFPDAANAARWRSSSVELQVAAYAVPADLTSEAVVNGVTLAARLDGSNALPDGTVVNHHRIHPDYMGNIQHLWWAIDFAALGGVPVARSALTHADLVYGAFASVDFVAGASSAAGNGDIYARPGGTIYRSGDVDPSVIYYPDGTDWGPARWTPFMSLDAHAYAYRLAPAAAWSAEIALREHTRAHRDLVAASGTDDGRTYSLDESVALSQDKYEGREEYAAQQLATTWLALYLGRHTTVAVDDTTYPVPGAERTERGAFRGSSSPKHSTLSP